MSLYFLIKTLHIISSGILFGTGIGIAFFMFRSHFTRSIQEKHYAIQNTVLADFIFTTPAVIIQPLSGFWLMHYMGYSWSSLWLLKTYALYLLIGCFWLPVVVIQIQLKKLLNTSLTTSTPLPERYQILFKRWFIFGFPAFFSLIGIFYLMVAKPS